MDLFIGLVRLKLCVAFLELFESLKQAPINIINNKISSKMYIHIENIDENPCIIVLIDEEGR